MIDIEINRKDMEVKVYVGDESPPAKREKLDDESFKAYMIELSGDNIEEMRKVAKMFKPTKYIFKDVK